MLEVGFRQYSLDDTPAVECHINVIQDFFFFMIFCCLTPFQFAQANLKICVKTDFLDLFDLCLCLLQTAWKTVNKSTKFNVCLKVKIWRQKMVCPEDGAAANTGSLIFCNCVTPFHQKYCTISHTRIKKWIYLINYQHIKKCRECSDSTLISWISWNCVNVTDFTRTALFYCLIYN